MTLGPKPSVFEDRLVRRMAVTCLVGFGGFFLWAGLAPLEEGIAAVGKVIVEEDRQRIQHLEGGIISDLQVREGDYVEAGQTLLVLQSTASKSVRDQVIQDYSTNLAATVRLKALLEGLENLDFDSLDTVDLDADVRSDIVARETALFEQEKQSQNADIAVLRAKMNSARQTAGSKSLEVEIAERALQSAKAELEVIQDMVEAQLARQDKRTEAERLVATIEGNISKLNGDSLEAELSVQDLEAQIGQVRARNAQRWASERLETSGKVQAAREQLQTAQDILARSVVISPVSGEVLNLSASTIGGVIKPGETLMEIVPPLSTITASVQIMPQDRPSVHEGLLVRTQLSAYKGWQAPRLDGQVIGVSADLKTDPVTGIDYYEARIRIPQTEIMRIENANILPGMPVDAFIYAGNSRTLLEYVAEPLSDSLFKGLRQG